MMKHLFFCSFFLLPILVCSQSFSAGKNLYQLQQAVHIGIPFQQKFILPRPERHTGAQFIASRVFLPKWISEELPLFCKIEHKMGKKMAVPLKFRLGSVEYVDRLEYPGRWGVE